MQILIAQINPTVGDLSGNLSKILKAIQLGKKKSAHIVLFPELALSGYPPLDFLLLPSFIKEIEHHLKAIIEESKGIAVVVGLPRQNPAKGEKGLYNSAAIIEDGQLLGFQDKSLLPTYDVFDECRYFDSATSSPVWKLAGKKVGITICEDIWQHSRLLKETIYGEDPIERLLALRPELVLNLSASPFSVNKLSKRLKVCQKVAQTLGCPFILCNQVGSNDSLIFDGHSVFIGDEGQLHAIGKGFEEDYIVVNSIHPPSVAFEEQETIKDLYQALILGVRDYFWKSGFTRACLGLSGGIDSAVVACIAADALGAANILGVSMPSRYSSEGSLQDARMLAGNLKVDFRVISIEKPFQAYLDTLLPEFEGKPADVTEENLQARIRGMILMALSNKHGYIVLSTGNKSELALGYSTLYGDMCGGMAVISDLTKRQVYALAHFINRKKAVIPLNTIMKPPSAELRPNQLDSDSLPDYEVVDNVIESYIERHLSKEEIAEKFGYALPLVESLIIKIHKNEYKRRQSPPGLRVTEKAFSMGRHFPIVQRFV